MIPGTSCKGKKFMRQPSERTLAAWQRQRFVRKLREEGKIFREIATILRISITTTRRIYKKSMLPPGKKHLADNRYRRISYD